MIPELLQRIRENKRAQKVILVGMFLFFVLVAAILFWPRQTFEEHKLVKANLSADKNFGHLSGSSIYAYNGLAFYKVNLTSNNAITTLSSGTKLPTPEYLYWANDHGALLNFKESFIATKVDDEIRARGLRPNASTQAYTWYFDFVSGSLKLVNEKPVQPGFAVFSETDTGFYYLPQVSGDTTPLHFFNTQTGQDQVVSNDLNAIDVSYLGDCPGQKVCFIARNPEDARFQRLFAIDQNNQKKQLLDSRGRLFPTNDGNLYISVETGEAPKPHANEEERFEEEDVLYEEAPARLHNIKDDSVRNLGFDVGNSDIITHFKDSNEFFTLDNSLVKDQSSEDEVHDYRAGKVEGSFGDPQNKLFPLTFLNDELFIDGILKASHGTENESLITTFAGNQLLFTTEDKNRSFIPINQKNAQAKVDQCVQASAQDSQYFDEGGLFKIFFTQDPDFDTNIKTFSDCLLKSNVAEVIGFNYYLGGVSPDGRITTD